jgi:nitrous oxidase accessory protein NosD
MFDRPSRCRSGRAPLATAAVMVLMLGALRAGTLGAANATSGPVGEIAGTVVRADGQPVAGAAVVLCDRSSGIPLARGTLQPFTNDRTQTLGSNILFCMTASDGRFTFDQIPVGSYRLVAQSWRDKASIRAVPEVNGEEIELHGTANDLGVTGGGTVDVVLRPLGTGTLRMDQRVPNNATFLILSTAPTGADPVLGFTGWTSSFLRNALGGNRMPRGRTVVHGLPEGTVYVAMFAADDVPGFLNAEVQIKAGQTTFLPFTPFVAGWSNGRHDPPPELMPIFEEIKAMPRREAQVWFGKVMGQAGVQADPKSDRPQLSGHLDAEVLLPSGRKATLGQVMAAAGYIQLQDSVARRAGRSLAAPAHPPKPATAPSELQRLIDAAQPGATVMVPKGTHTVPIQIIKPLALKGSAPEDCLMEVTANGPALFVDTGGQGQVVIEGLTIKWQLATSGERVEQPAALAVKDTDAAIRNCRFVPLGNAQRSPVAIRIEGRSKATVSDCWLKGFDFVINYGPGTEGLVEDCLLRDGGHQGVTGYDRSTLRVERTIVAGFKYHGLRCTGGTLHAKDNVLMDNKVSGVYLGNKDGQGTLTNNLMICNSEGVAAFYQARFEIRNNLILDSTAAGIGMWDTCRLQISDNIFQGNAKALVVYPKGGKDNNVIGTNAFWQNKVDTENCRRAEDSIAADPLFLDPRNGDYSLKPGPSLEHKQGLTDPQAIRRLLERWKTDTKVSIQR